MSQLHAPAKQSGTRAPYAAAPLLGCRGARQIKESLRDLFLLPSNPLRLRSHPACFASAYQLCGTKPTCTSHRKRLTQTRHYRFHLNSAPRQEQIRKNTVFGVAARRPRLRVDGLNTHLAHQSLNMLTIHVFSQLAVQRTHHLTRSEERRTQVLLVDETHQTQVVIAFLDSLVVVGRTAQPKQFALPANADRRVTWIHE